jgi:protein CpxP
MKKVLVIFALSLGFVVTATAQQEERPERTPEKMAARSAAHLAEKLELDDAQKQKIYEIQLQHSAERKSEMEALRKQMQARREAQQAEISAVLTPEQKEKWEEMHQQRKERSEAWSGRREERRGEQPMHRKRGGYPGPQRGGPRSNS